MELRSLEAMVASHFIAPSLARVSSTPSLLYSSPTVRASYGLRLRHRRFQYFRGLRPPSASFSSGYTSSEFDSDSEIIEAEFEPVVSKPAPSFDSDSDSGSVYNNSKLSSASFSSSGTVDSAAPRPASRDSIGPARDLNNQSFADPLAGTSYGTGSRPRSANYTSSGATGNIATEVYDASGGGKTSNFAGNMKESNPESGDGTSGRSNTGSVDKIDWDAPTTLKPAYGMGINRESRAPNPNPVAYPNPEGSHYGSSPIINPNPQYPASTNHPSGLSPSPQYGDPSLQYTTGLRPAANSSPQYTSSGVSPVGNVSHSSSSNPSPPSANNPPPLRTPQFGAPPPTGYRPPSPQSAQPSPSSSHPPFRSVNIPPARINPAFGPPTAPATAAQNTQNSYGVDANPPSVNGSTLPQRSAPNALNPPYANISNRVPGAPHQSPPPPPPAPPSSLRPGTPNPPFGAVAQPGRPPYGMNNNVGPPFGAPPVPYNTGPPVAPPFHLPPPNTGPYGASTYPSGANPAYALSGVPNPYPPSPNPSFAPQPGSPYPPPRATTPVNPNPGYASPSPSYFVPNSGFRAGLAPSGAPVINGPNGPPYTNVPNPMFGTSSGGPHQSGTQLPSSFQQLDGSSRAQSEAQLVPRESFSEVMEKYGKEHPVMLKFIWLEKRLGLALDNVVSEFGSFPLTPYFFFPETDALSELKSAIEKQHWISTDRASTLMKQAEELTSLWQKTSA